MGEQPFFAAVTCLHFKTIFAGRESAIASGMGVGTCPLGIIARESIAELDVRGAGEKSRVEEEDNVGLSGLKIDVRPGDTVGHVWVIGEGPTGDGGSWTERARFFSDVGRVDEALGCGEPEGTVSGSSRRWGGGSAAFAGTHAIPLPKTTVESWDCRPSATSCSSLRERRTIPREVPSQRWPSLSSMAVLMRRGVIPLLAGSAVARS